MSLNERMKRKEKPRKETLRLTREQWLQAIRDDIDPMHYAGEGFTATDEIARPADIKQNKYLLARVLNEEDYWPTRGRK